MYTPYAWLWRPQDCSGELVLPGSNNTALTLDIRGVCGGRNETLSPGPFELTSAGLLGSEAATCLLLLLGWGCPVLLCYILAKRRQVVSWRGLQEERRQAKAEMLRAEDEAARIVAWATGRLSSSYSIASSRSGVSSRGSRCGACGCSAQGSVAGGQG